MKTMNVILLSFLILFTVNSCKKENNEPGKTPIDDIELSLKDKALVQSSNEFGLELFAEIIETEDQSNNVFISPLSVAFALAMTYNGAEEETKTAMEETLKLSGLSADEINNSFKYLMNALINLDPDVLMQIANSIWYRDSFSVEAEFIDVNQQFYNAEVAALDFTDPSAVKAINNWVAENTNDKITEIIDQISAQAVMYLINAIYFKATWLYEFETSKTENRSFYLVDGTSIMVPTMTQKADLNYFEDDFMQVLELPYGGDKFNMLILLPKNNYTTNDIVAQMTDENWNSWLNGLYETELNVFLPKFKFEYEKMLNDVLSTMGMGVAFDEMLANFSKINPNAQLFISKVKHKTYIDVNEEGTEAAAVTVVEMELTSVGDEVYFTVNKPFIFAIREKSTNSILFMGRVSKPEYE